MKQDKKILDATCGSRSIWFDKNHPLAVYCDCREECFEGVWKNSTKSVEIKPDIIADFTSLPFGDESFKLVIFDPPHLKYAKATSWLVKKYGKLDENWPQMLRDGFTECMRVLEPYGILIFKWAEHDIPAAKVWSTIGQKPLFGHRSGKHSMTFWGAYMKLPEEPEPD